MLTRIVSILFITGSQNAFIHKKKSSSTLEGKGGFYEDLFQSVLIRYSVTS